MIDIENMKYIVEQEIKKRHFESLQYVLFDENKRLPWAFHLFYRDGKFMINGRDDRSYVMGNTIEFTSFEDAKIAFLERLEHFVKSNQFRVQIGETPDYSSPLWDEKENHQKMRDESKERSELLLAIQDLGYSSLRYSIFSEEKPGEWEVVIEYNQVENLYFVYGTMDRGSFNGKHGYHTFQEAKTKFLDFLADIVIINRYYVKEGMPVNYPSPLWDEKEDHQKMRDESEVKIMQLKQELMELLLKIGETNLNQSDLFTEEKPSLFLPEGRTIYLEGDYYYIVGVERGKINSEKKFDNKEDILYYLLQSYVTRIASKNAWANANGDFDRYDTLFQEEQIRLFSIINPKYGERRRKEIDIN